MITRTSGLTLLAQKIQERLDTPDVALFMKGTPDAIMCGNKRRTLGALRRAGTPITAVDVLLDLQIREDLPALSAGRRSRRSS